MTAAGSSRRISVTAVFHIWKYWALLTPHGQKPVPSGSFHVHCTDVPGEWLVTTDDDGALVVRREHAKGDAALRGPAEAILLRLWDRPGARAGELDVVGDAAVADAWLALPGM